MAEAQARAAAQLKETQDRLAAEAAKRQAELDAELAAKLRRGRGAGSAPPSDAALAEIQGVAAEVAQAAVQRLAGIEVAARGRSRPPSRACWGRPPEMLELLAARLPDHPGRRWSGSRPRRPCSAPSTAAAEKIRSELDEAQRLHEEAKALLAKYQRQLHEGEALAAEIVAQAEAAAAALRGEDARRLRARR